MEHRAAHWAFVAHELERAFDKLDRPRRRPGERCELCRKERALHRPASFLKVRGLKRYALCVALIASVFPLTGCMFFSPQFFACVVSVGREACAGDIFEPGPPSPPVLQAGALGMHWDPVSDTDLAGYNIYRSTTSGGPYDLVASTGKQQPDSYGQSELAPCTTYYYVVTAFDTLGQESAFSNEFAYTTDCPPGAQPPPPRPKKDKDGGYQPPGGHGRVMAPGYARSDARIGPEWFRFQLMVSGKFRSGHGQMDGGTLSGSAYVVEGPFGIVTSSPGSRLEPTSPETQAQGTWRSRIDWRFDLRAGTGTATGIAVAAFAAPRAGRVCLRFVEAYVRDRRPAATSPVAASGTFTVIGGEGSAANLLGRAQYDVRTRADGSVLYYGRARASRGALPELPAECRELAGS